MKKFCLPLLILSLLFLSCSKQINLSEGSWRAVLTPDTTRPQLELPFNISFELLEDKWHATIYNAEERIEVREITETEDSVILQMPVFKGLIKLAKTPSVLSGQYTHRAAGKGWSAPNILEPGVDKRFDLPNIAPTFDPGGKWKVIVNPDSDHPETQVGLFERSGSKLTGTFLTVVGDYRFLEGTVSGDKFRLSCFDGAHSLLFTARLTPEGTLEDGIFTGGPTWKGTWRAERDPDIELPDATSLTYLKPGYNDIEFSFPSIEGGIVSLTDSQFKNKAVIVQIIGSWCPNCMDETRFFAELYNKYNNEGLELIALCYESDNQEKSFDAIRRFKEGTGAGYTFLHAGVANKRLASQTLPMLNRIISYPTSIFIDRSGKIRKIFTGFSGPGTGEHYDNLTREMIALTEELIKE